MDDFRCQISDGAKVHYTAGRRRLVSGGADLCWKHYGSLLDMALFCDERIPGWSVTAVHLLEAGAISAPDVSRGHCISQDDLGCLYDKWKSDLLRSSLDHGRAWDRIGQSEQQIFGQPYSVLDRDGYNRVVLTTELDSLLFFAPFFSLSGYQQAVERIRSIISPDGFDKEVDVKSKKIKTLVQAFFSTQVAPEDLKSSIHDYPLLLKRFEVLAYFDIDMSEYLVRPHVMGMDEHQQNTCCIAAMEAECGAVTRVPLYNLGLLSGEHSSNHQCCRDLVLTLLETLHEQGVQCSHEKEDSTECISRCIAAVEVCLEGLNELIYTASEERSCNRLYSLIARLLHFFLRDEHFASYCPTFFKIEQDRAERSVFVKLVTGIRDDLQIAGYDDSDPQDDLQIAGYEDSDHQIGMVRARAVW